MKKILVVIDMQNDFITDALPAAGGVEIVPKVVEKIHYNYDAVIFTRDTHFESDYYDSYEGKHIPIHCIYQSDGWNIIPEIDVHQLVSENGGRVAIIDKLQFGSSDMLVDEVVYQLAKINQDQKISGDYTDLEIHLCGVCTDICVITNAIILKAEFPDARIVVDSSACAGTTLESHFEALHIMKNCLIDVV